MDAPDELDRVRDESLARLAAGRLPVEAERRMTALRDRRDFFTSDLSVTEFALARDVGLTPVSQVMGSCVFHASWRANQIWTGWTPGEMSSEPLVARPYNQARNTAFERMRLEADACGAHAVVGVHVTRGEGEYEMNSVEFVALGTAVRVDGPHPHGGPVMTALSGQDYWRLVKSGHQALGVVACTEIISCVPTVATQQGQAYGRLSRSGRVSREVEEFSGAVQHAIGNASLELRNQAARLGADGIVGVKFDRHQLMIERENPDYQGYGGGYSTFGGSYRRTGYYRRAGQPAHREDLIVIVHAIGTAIRAGEAPASRPRPNLTIQPVRRLDNTYETRQVQ